MEIRVGIIDLAVLGNIVLTALVNGVVIGLVIYHIQKRFEAQNQIKLETRKLRIEVVGELYNRFNKVQKALKVLASNHVSSIDLADLEPTAWAAEMDVQRKQALEDAKVIQELAEEFTDYLSKNTVVLPESFNELLKVFNKAVQRALLLRLGYTNARTRIQRKLLVDEQITDEERAYIANMEEGMSDIPELSTYIIAEFRKLLGT